MGLLSDWKKCLKWPTFPRIKNQPQIEFIHSHQTHRLETCIIDCGGMNTTQISKHHKHAIIAAAQNPDSVIKNIPYSAHERDVNEAYETVYLLYVKKRLSDLRDNWNDDEVHPLVKEIDDHIRSALGRDDSNFQGFLAKSGITQEMNESASSLSPMTSVVGTIKHDFIKLIHDLDQALKPKTMLTHEIAQELGLRVAPELLSFILDQDKGLPQWPAPSGMR